LHRLFALPASRLRWFEDATMLTFTAGRTRREFLSLGSCALGGLALSSFARSPLLAAPPPSVATGKAVIFLFLQGGPSQLETFDPKTYGSHGTMTGTIATSVPGVEFGERLPRLAEIAHKLTIYRSYQSGNAGHNIKPIVSDDSLNANIGSLYSRVVGPTRKATGMPTNSVVFADASCEDVLKGKARGDIKATGQLGSLHAPFVPGAGGRLQEDMRLNLPRDRFDIRRNLIPQLSALSRRIDAAGELEQIDQLQRQAYQVLLGGGTADALDLSLEDPRVVARYDTAQFARADGWSKSRRGQQGMYDGHARAIGKQLLLARRLVEAGCGYVTIHDGYDGVWDWHGDNNNLGVIDGAEACMPSFDHAVAAFIEDIEARGLRDNILLVITGEMGRGPGISRRGGRDHWGKSTPLVLYGARVAPGVIGATDRRGGEPTGDPLSPKHLVSTILHTLVDPGQLRLIPGLESITKLTEHPRLS
jgi:uncharacterized protein (DUF1501 family)